jgi:hypothetical protein
MTSADTKPTLIDARIYEPGDYPPERGEGVRAPVAPIRIAVGAPDPLGLGVGEHDAPGGAAPCSCGAWHRAPVAELAPLPSSFDALQASTRAVLATMHEEDEAAQRFVDGEPAPLPCPSGAEAHNRALLAGHRCTACGVARQDAADPAPREPSAPTDDPGELARLLPGLLDLARARIKALTIPGPPPLNLASESIKLARACELLLGERERLTAEGTEKIADRDCDIAMLRARVAELEAERVREPAGHRVAALLADLKRMREEGDGGMREAIEAVREYLGAPTPLDRAVAEVCALPVEEGEAIDHWNAIDVEVDATNAGDGETRESFARVAALALAGMLACDAAPRPVTVGVLFIRRGPPEDEYNGVRFRVEARSSSGIMWALVPTVGPMIRLWASDDDLRSGGWERDAADGGKGGA